MLHRVSLCTVHTTFPASISVSSTLKWAETRGLNAIYSWPLQEHLVSLKFVDFWRERMSYEATQTGERIVCALKACCKPVTQRMEYAASMPWCLDTLMLQRSRHLLFWNINSFLHFAPCQGQSRSHFILDLQEWSRDFNVAHSLLECTHSFELRLCAPANMWEKGERRGMNNNIVTIWALASYPRLACPACCVDEQ